MEMEIHLPTTEQECTRETHYTNRVVSGEVSALWSNLRELEQHYQSTQTCHLCSRWTNLCYFVCTLWAFPAALVAWNGFLVSSHCMSALKLFPCLTNSSLSLPADSVVLHALKNTTQSCTVAGFLQISPGVTKLVCAKSTSRSQDAYHHACNVCFSCYNRSRDFRLLHRRQRTLYVG